jgi:hypothetical protein
MMHGQFSQSLFFRDFNVFKEQFFILVNVGSFAGIDTEQVTFHNADYKVCSGG